MKLNLPKSIKRFIRGEKARIRREFSDITQQRQQIAEVYKKFVKTPGDVKPEEKPEQKSEKKAEKMVEKKKEKTKNKKEAKPKDKAKK